MIALSQFFIKKFRPAFFAFLTRIIYSGSRVRIGKGFRTDSIPRIIVDKGCRLEIGLSAEFRRNIEIRVHKASKVHIGDNVRIDRGVRILATNQSTISLNNGCRIGLYSVFNGGGSISVGNKALVSGFVYLQTSMHKYDNKHKSVQDQGFTHAPVVLEDDTWLGTHVVVLPGVTISKGAVVGSNAVVVRDVSENQVVVGIPAKAIKER
jgi:acetyltransferase-like isoleucine patch superfamily enzyme